MLNFDIVLKSSHSLWIAEYNVSLTLFYVWRNSKIKSDVVDNRWHYVILLISDEKVKVYIDNDVKCEINENITLKANESYEVKFQGL